MKRLISVALIAVVTAALLSGCDEQRTSDSRKPHNRFAGSDVQDVFSDDTVIPVFTEDELRSTEDDPDGNYSDDEAIPIYSEIYSEEDLRGPEYDPYDNYSEDAAISISSEYDLRSIENNPDGCYYLTNDIDLSQNSNWIPLCSDSRPFTGTLDGNGYCIKNITVDVWYSDTIEDSEYAGLFSCVSGATIKNLGIVGGTVSIHSASYNGDAGALAGKSSVKTADGIIKLTEVSNCWVNVTVKSNLIENGTTSYGATMSIGSFFGRGCANFKDCYSLGKVDAALSYADQIIGGFIGNLNSYDKCTMTIKSCYNAGSFNCRYVSGDKPGAFIGYSLTRGIIDVDIVDSYYGNDTGEYRQFSIAMTDNKDNAFTSVKGMSVEGLKIQSNFSGFDFDNTWSISADINDGFPFLKVQKSFYDGSSSPDNNNNRPDSIAADMSVEELRKAIIGEWYEQDFSINTYTFLENGGCKISISGDEIGNFEITEDKTLKIKMSWITKRLPWDVDSIYSSAGWCFSSDGTLILQGNIYKRK